MKKKIITVSVLLLGNLFCQTPVYYPGFPKIVDSASMPSSYNNVPLITDLEKDGQKEIILSTYGDKLYIFKSDGSILSGFPVMINGSIISSASGDVNGNGILDIVIRTRTQIFVIDKWGNSIPGFPVTYQDGSVSTARFLSIYDLNNDGRLEIIVNKNREICVFNFDGTILTGWPRNIVGTSLSHPAIGDIDNDGLPEIIAATYRQIPQGGADSSALRIFRSDGSNFSNNWPVYYDSNYINWHASPSIYLNKNNPNDNFITITQSGLRVGQYLTSRNIKYNIYGDVISKSYVISFNNMGGLVFGDLNRDGLLEFANGPSGNHHDILFYAYSNGLNILNNWPRTGGGAFLSTPIIGKFRFGKELSVLSNTWSADTTGGGYGGYIFGYNPDGSQLSWSPLRPDGLVYAISCADINNDGSVELIAISSKYANETRLDIWTFPGIQYKSDDFPWPQFGHDRYRTNQYGFVPPDEPIGILPISNIIPDRFVLEQNYPNPFNPATNIKFSIPASHDVKIAVFDILGRELIVLVNEKLMPGEYNVSWDASSFSSGVYFYKLEAGSFIATKKMILMK